MRVRTSSSSSWEWRDRDGEKEREKRGGNQSEETRRVEENEGKMGERTSNELSQIFELCSSRSTFQGYD